jgi:hypothetical protein
MLSLVRSLTQRPSEPVIQSLNRTLATLRNKENHPHNSKLFTLISLPKQFFSAKVTHRIGSFERRGPINDVV